ncbi:uncharacterized protein LOC120009961 isoform X2 [Tripterygium wilfordii]|uniref:uncharacterized protein LOC120009961 isoform X2 n=1 Tax=Tripterygium wilfordii TaxID=458696 RepID=UPI0018F81644|nr:uncharacterized protein LOC120009961 isoform X2 [Tripterygium wilfordii]
MAKSSISHLLQLRRRFSLSSQNPNFILSRLLKPFSTASASPATSPESPKPSSLSARMSFVFDQIDSIERERSQKDETLQKIRAWRQSRNNPTQQNPELGSSYPTGSAELTQTNPAELEGSSPQLGIGVVKKKKNEVELVHPWPEWIELMERLVQQNYFDHKRRDEDKIVQELGLDVPENADADGVGIDFSDFKTIQTACLNFGKDRFDILRSLSRQDIQVLVGYGCPTADKKVVFSAKLLRKHVHLDEGDVCSSCSLRSSCERAYLLTNKEDEARTIDIMRVLLAYGFDPINGSLVNKSLMKQKSLKTVVRKLLHEVVKLSAVPIDPNLPPPIIKRPPPKVKQPPPPPKKRVGRDDVEMKKGDWLCPKCDFMNFAKNTVCLQCDAKRPKRQLLPGEWECPQCNFLNYRRNMACFHCDCKRPPDEFVENQMQATQRGGKTRLDKIASRDEVSKAWNFDFDDDESDGADVAAFEYGDSAVTNEDSPLISRPREGNFRGPEDDSNISGRNPRFRATEYSNPHHNRPGMGFDDFDEDNVDSYELDTQNNDSVRRASFSEVEGFSDSDDIEDSDDKVSPGHRTRTPPYRKPPKSVSRKATPFGSEGDEMDFDSDEELSVHSNWKSSHVADRSRRRGSTGPSRGLSYGSDEEFGLQSDAENDFRSREQKGRRSGSSFSGSESDDHDLHSRENRSRKKNIEPGGRRNKFNGRGDFDFGRDAQLRSNGKRGSRSSFGDDFDGSSSMSRGKHRGFGSKDHSGWKMNGRRSDFHNSKGAGQEGFGNKWRGGSKEYDMDKDPGEYRNSRRVIER